MNQTLQKYVEVLKTLIAQENNILFPMGKSILTREDQASLEASFKNVEEHDTGVGVHEKFYQLAHGIDE
jgi:hemerythrin-like domain-containing protein